MKLERHHRAHGLDFRPAGFRRTCRPLVTGFDTALSDRHNSYASGGFQAWSQRVITSGVALVRTRSRVVGRGSSIGKLHLIPSSRTGTDYRQVLRPSPCTNGARARPLRPRRLCSLLTPCAITGARSDAQCLGESGGLAIEGKTCDVSIAPAHLRACHLMLDMTIQLSAG